jgi:hypothetical protein
MILEKCTRCDARLPPSQLMRLRCQHIICNNCYLRYLVRCTQCWREEVMFM